MGLEKPGHTNGTRVGTATLAAGEARPVKDGDVLCFGSVEVRIATRPA